MDYKFRVQCPACKAFYRCKLEDYNSTELNPDGTIAIAIRPDTCHHFFMVYLDAKLNARTTQLITEAKVDISLIRSDPENLLQKEKDLNEKHQEALKRGDHAHVDELWQELKRVRKEITRVGLD
nr:hypothetical protein [Candidatus Sigynarchaeota archaeon]